MTTRRPTVAVYKFSSCDGCQLSLLNMEDELLDLAGVVDFAFFLEATRASRPGPYDLALVEGSITTPHEADRIKEVRRDARILVVDDDPAAVELLALAMQGTASTVLRAYGGREAIDSALRELPDVILLDLMMPETNGFDVVAALIQHPETANIPILVLTAKEITAADRARLNGYVTAIMEKGEFGPARITAEVRRAMSGRRQVS